MPTPHRAQQIEEGQASREKGLGVLFSYFLRSIGFSEFLGSIHISGPDMSRTAVSLPLPLPYRPLHHFLQGSEAPARPVSYASLVREGSNIRAPLFQQLGPRALAPSPSSWLPQLWMMTGRYPHDCQLLVPLLAIAGVSVWRHRPPHTRG